MDVLCMTSEELTAQHAEMLPRREALGGLFSINVAPVTVVSLALAVNAASIGASAEAWAGGIVGVSQG